MSIILIKWSNVLKALSFFLSLLQCNQKEIIIVERRKVIMKNKKVITSILSLAFVFMFSLGCVSAATQTRNVVVYTTKGTSGLIICINEHKATCTNSKAKSTVSTKYLVTGGTQSIQNLDSGKTAQIKVTGRLGNAEQTKYSKITF